VRRSLVFCLSVCLIGLISCSKVPHPISSAIAREVSKGEGTVVRIASLTNFDWDQVYLFHPYYDKDSIHEVIGKQFLSEDELELGVSISEGEVLFVFMKDSRLVTHFFHPRRKGDFSEFKNHPSFTPEKAIFQVVYEKDGFWWKRVRMVLYEDLARNFS
jgi:hypothetical protein